MDIQYLIQMLQNKITALNNARSQALSIGDFEQLSAIEQELLDTQHTFSQLTMLVDMTQAAVAANVTAAEIVSSGIDALQNVSPTIQGPSAGAVINGYDVSAYATDALYEEKIRAILSGMIVFSTPADVDAYIQDMAAESPVTGDMVYAAVNQYSIDLPLLLAIMQNDSAFGTKGVGATTNNPGNIGNTGSATKSFGSWDEGVMAVAEWLSRHRAV
jgi:hypothetical protein